MSKKKDSYVPITRNQYDELMLAVAYAIIRSDQAINMAHKTNKTVENVVKKS